MALQILNLSIVASETSAQEVKALITGCAIGDIRGIVNTKYRDYSAEDILDELSLSKIDVQRAVYSADDSPSTLDITIYVPDGQKARLKEWIDENGIFGEAYGALLGGYWGVEVGDTVLMPQPNKTDSWNREFQGNVIGFRGIFAKVEDGDNNIFDIEVHRFNNR